jgi:hypothetical protein
MRSTSQVQRESNLKKEGRPMKFRMISITVCGFLAALAVLVTSLYAQSQVTLTVDTGVLGIGPQSLPGIKVNGNPVYPLPQTLSFSRGALVTLEAASQTAHLPNEACLFQFWLIGGRYFHKPTVAITLDANTTAVAWYSCHSTFGSGINVDAWSFELGGPIPGGAQITVTPPGTTQTTFFFWPLTLGSQVAFQAPCQVTTPQYVFVFHGWTVTQGVNVVAQSGQCQNIITVQLTSPFATVIAFYETEKTGRQVELTISSNCDNAEIDVNGQKVSGKGGKFKFTSGDTVQLSVKDFPTINFCGVLPAVHTFDGWYEIGTLKSKAQQYTFTITQDTQILAKYGLGGTGRQCEVVIGAKALPSLTQIPGVEIKVSPNDLQGQGNGQTPFVRLFDENTEFTLDAPLEWPTTAPKYGFHNWDVQGAQVTPVSRTAVKLRCTSGNVWANALYEERGPLADLAVNLPTVSVSKPDGTGMCTVMGVAVVRNIGQGDAGPFATGIFVDGKSFPDFDFPSLGLKAGAAESVPFIVVVPIGKHLLEAIADWKNEVNESDEKNNKASRIVECQGE